MKIVLLSPYPDILAFGVRILSACLKRAGHNVKLVFLPRNFLKRYEEQTLNDVVDITKDADLIGISVMTNFFDNVIQITQAIKAHSNAPVVWGGIHVTVRPEECLNYADMVCVGEGEETLLELATSMERGEGLRSIKGIWFKDNGEIVKNELRPLIQNLDSLPFPDFDYDTHFILSDGKVQRMNEELLKVYLTGIYLTMPTRGCPFGCSYCCNNLLNKMYSGQRPVRKRRIDSIIRELKEATARCLLLTALHWMMMLFLSIKKMRCRNSVESIKKTSLYHS